MAQKTTDRAKLSLKLMVHKRKQRVMFAEADSDFVDTLFSIMTLPLGTILRVLEKSPDEEVEALGSLRNLYNSLMDLSTIFLTANESKHMLLNPRSSSYNLCRYLKLNIDDTDKLPKYFACQNPLCTMLRISSFAFHECAKCHTCGKLMNREIEAYSSSYSTRFDGFVTNATTFIVTDDLQVIPNTPGYCIQLLFNLGITDASQLEERNFDIDRDKILILLKWALLCKYPLSCMVFQNLYVSEIFFKAEPDTLIQKFTSIEAGPDSKVMTLKVTLRKSNSKFLFAVVEADFVDFILGFLEIPLGTLIGKLLNGNSSLESLDNLFASISTINLGYIKSQDLKDVLLQHKLAWNHVTQNKIFSLDVAEGSKIYCHQRINPHIIYKDKDKDNAALRYQNPREHGGVVQALSRFLLTDDFVLTPVSSISTISMLSKFKVPLDDIMEHEVSIGIEEGLRILKASLKSSTIFTDALLKGNSWKFQKNS